MNKCTQSTHSFGGLVLILGLLLGGCSGRPSGLNAEMMMSPDGTERDRPSTWLFLRLVKASHEERVAMVSRVCKVISGEGGYSCVAAARALLYFLESFPEYWTQECATTIGGCVVKIAGIPYLNDEVAVQHLGNPDITEDVETRIDPTCYMCFDGVEMRLRDRLPKGCWAEDVSVVLDGRVISEQRGPYRGFVYERVWLEDELGKDGEVLGDHVLSSSFVLVTPNGGRHTVRGEVTFSVYYDKYLPPPKPNGKKVGSGRTMGAGVDRDGVGDAGIVDGRGQRPATDGSDPARAVRPDRKR